MRARAPGRPEPPAEAWESLLAAVPGAGPFHEHAWRRALAEAHPGLEDATLWIEDGAGLRAALPVMLRRRGFLARASSLPYGTAGGPWLRDPAERGAAAALLAEFARRYARPWNDCVMTDQGPPVLESLFREAWPSARPRAAETHRLTLPATLEELEQCFERRTRKATRRAEALRLELDEPPGETGIAEFMALQRREQAARGRRFEYPAALFRAGRRDGWLRIVRARRAGETLALTAVAEGRGVFFAWLIVQSPAAREAPTGEYLFAELLRQAVRRGMREADFGSSGGREGARFFKAGFGAEPSPYRIWRSGPFAGARA